MRMSEEKKNYKGRPIEIMLVEDNPGDVLLTREAFADAKISNNIQVANDGEQALELLRAISADESKILPDIILLDLNLPRKDGRQVLTEIKEDEALKHIPVVVLSSSKAESDIAETYKLHANSYIVKPIDLSQFMDIVSAIEGFWFTVVVMPGEKN